MMRKFPFFILLICSFSFSIKKLEGQIPSNVPKSGLVAWYPFNGNANDESGNGLNGKVDKAILTKDRFGILNKAYYFDSSRVITIPETVNKNLFPLSVSLWVQIDTSKVSGLGNLFGKYIAASWNGFLIQTMRRVDSVGNVTFKIVPWYIRDANNRLLGLYGEEDFATDLIPGKWHHFVFTVGKDKGAAYLDGKLFDTHLWTGNSGQSTNPYLWQIGGLYNDWFKGNLDDIGVWNRELTSEEVKNLYDGESTTGQPCSSSPTVKDIDGNTYNTVQIGGQCWTKENLKVTKYNDGSTIPLDNSGGTAGNGSGQTWSTLKTGARTVYGHDNNNLTTYGYLYNWYAASDSRNICPSGWHLPSDEELTTLTTYLGGSTVAGGKLKATGTTYWSNNAGASNTSGFTALGSGFRSAGSEFSNIKTGTFFWSSSSKSTVNAWQLFLTDNDNLTRRDSSPNENGFSIRCVKDVVNNTPCPGTPTVKDIDGNTYNTLQIGEQCWTKENLKVTKYNDGSTIPLDNSGGTAGNGSGQTWSTLKTGARTIYGHDNNNLSTYGYLYNWYAASDSRNICPSGWHLPSDEELTTLTTYLGGSTVAGGKLKATGTTYWSNNAGASNTSGFTALGSGFRSAGSEFSNIKTGTFFWSSSSKSTVNAWQLFLTDNDNLTRRDSSPNKNGFSIRCIKNKVESSTSCPGTPTVKDIDGNTYNTVQIGEQCWTKENLKTTKYNDGSTIPNVKDDKLWSQLSTGGWSNYNNDPVNDVYGKLYNWHTVDDSRGICPKGWHVPNDSEWTILTKHLGGTSVAGGKMKVPGTTYWYSPNSGATNESGFSAISAGLRAGDDGSFGNLLGYNYTWSKNKGRFIYLAYDWSEAPLFTYPVTSGFSIRCIKDKVESSTSCPGTPTVKDIDGNIYNTVQIGGQCWTKENLKVTKYSDGSTIPSDNSGGTAGDGSGQTWSTLKTGARTVYGQDNNNLTTYGYLYNGYAASDSRNICPSGWHVPTDGEWTTLSDFLGGSAVAGGKLKSEGALWLNNIDASNTSGFTALPSGLRNSSLGDFVLIGSEAFFWSKTDFNGWAAYNRVLKNSTSQIFRQPSDHVYSAWYQTGVSIRCLRDSIIASLKITTTNIGSTTATSAISGGIITSTDNTSVTARGVCWNTTGTPTIQDSKTTDDSGYGSFESNLTYLQPNTLYYLRAYASTPNGTFYGNEITFKTKSLDSNAVVFFTPNVNISCDSIVEIPLLAYNFKGVLGAQGSLGWDASKLKFESIASFGPTSLGLTTNDFGLTDSQKGKISFIWNSINATTVTLPDSTALFVLKFKVIDTKLTIAVVKMNNDPIDIEVVDSNFDKMKFELGTYVINQICAKVSGNVQTSKSLNVPGVILTLSNSLGSKSAITDVNGNYSFSNISLANYTLTPSKLTEAKHRNGVSTLDIGLIQAHVLNKKPFQTPYQVIAADVNGSGTITAADIILIRRFILGAETNFGGKLYSFVDKKHVFTNPLNPFPFPQSININSTQSQVVGDFIGVKLGDVNFDNTPQNFVPKASRDRKIEFVYEIITPTVSKRSNEVIYRIKSAKQQELLGMQFTLNWDSKLAELVAIEHNPLGIFLANETGDNGSLGLSWNAGSGTPKMLQENEVVFEIRVKLNARYMSVPLNINDDLLEREAFDADFKVKELSLKLENVSNTVISTEVKLNVFPNPAQGNFTLNFNSNMAEKGYILLTDMLGRTLVNQEIQISKGMNNVMIDLPANIVTGTHNLQLRTSNTFETVKILIDNNK